ncbi:sugar phosphate isomerase/epimerase family protein [Niallia taxi]|uniref:sugar phosphate isomerase/epimerase family protein n=1 Tax=Niallia taxi TaxID=2499688 RepID=UPI002E1E0591|nr:TIM barrel protein [Niallia taxi]
MAESIKTGVSLYSYQEEFYTGKLDLEGCIQEVAKSGAQGVEILPEQMIKGFPHIPESFYETWHGWMEKYNLTPIAYDAFLELKLFPNRITTLDESVEMMKRDISIANKLGCKVLRTLVATPIEVIDASLEYAEEKDIKIALEVHAPFTFGTPWFEERMEYIQKTGTKWFGIMPDLGVFVKRMPSVMEDWHIRHGANPKIVEYVSGNYARRADMKAIEKEVQNMGSANEYDKLFARLGTHMVYTDPQILKDYIPYIMHVHGKFYEINNKMEEPSIPYNDIISVLKNNGYTGYVSSEYEGNRHIQDYKEVDSIEQVQRHQKLLHQIIHN